LDAKADRNTHLPAPTSHRWQVWQRVLPALIIGFFLANEVLSMWHESVTYDEPNHLEYGMAILHLDSSRSNDTEMPISALNAFPGRIAQAMPWEGVREFLSSTPVARMVTILASTALAIVVFRWGLMLYGYWAAVLSLVLFAADPNIAAHANLVTTDLFAALAVTATLYSFWRFSIRRDLVHAIAVAFLLGLSQLAKYTSLALYPILVMLLGLQDGPGILSWVRKRDWRNLRRYLLKGISYTILLAMVSVLVINVGFVFRGTLTRIGDYSFRSDLFRGIRERLRLLDDIPVPLPQPYIQGLDLVLDRDKTGVGYGPIYLLGVLRRGDGFPAYYLVAFLFKEPLASQILLLGAIGAYLVRRTQRSFLRNEAFLLLPAIVLIGYFSLAVNRQIGFRFVLVVLPLLQVFTGGLVARWVSLGGLWKAAIVGLAVYLAGSTLSYFPHYISYFNELVPDKRMAYRILADSNLDWGQSQWYLARYLAEHPEVETDPDFPMIGRFVVTANELVGVTEKPEVFRWLRECFLPVDTVAYSYLVYDVTQDDLLACQQGPLKNLSGD
jgi:hypothetical protein